MRKLQRAKTLENVQNYYGNVIQNKDDFQTQACIAPGRRVTPHVTQAISLVHTAVQVAIIELYPSLLRYYFTSRYYLVACKNKVDTDIMSPYRAIIGDQRI